MKVHAVAIAKPHWGVGTGLWSVPLLLLLAFFAAGCGALQDTAAPKDPETVMALQSPPAYGTIAQVTSADMIGKERRKGDIAITIDLDDGQVVMVIQSEDSVYVPGDRVRVLRDGETFIRAQLL